MANITMANSTTTTVKEAQMGVPTPFSGKRGELKKFLMTCKMHLQANRAIYNNDEKKVVFVLSFMTEGDAATWREQWLDELDEKQKQPTRQKWILAPLPILLNYSKKTSQHMMRLVML